MRLQQNLFLLYQTLHKLAIFDIIFIVVADLAQLVEQPPCKRQVVGSSPTVGSIFFVLKSGLEPKRPKGQTVQVRQSAPFLF